MGFSIFGSSSDTKKYETYNTSNALLQAETARQAVSGTGNYVLDESTTAIITETVDDDIAKAAFTANKDVANKSVDSMASTVENALKYSGETVSESLGFGESALDTLKNVFNSALATNQSVSLNALEFADNATRSDVSQNIETLIKYGFYAIIGIGAVLVLSKWK